MKPSECYDALSIQHTNDTNNTLTATSCFVSTNEAELFISDNGIIWKYQNLKRMNEAVEFELWETNGLNATRGVVAEKVDFLRRSLSLTVGEVRRFQGLKK
ncbi:MAG: hypothetical protein OD815_000798 [Candidatus Alkanophagales archaeon MCA70_species_2]|nr:hypothetical protein [Candidatus Alkanophaga liquidiphilum]RLG38512.1 MAG: hypothetical protein DRN91_02390 [Candidatus Alkanophagales archaeon]